MQYVSCRISVSTATICTAVLSLPPRLAAITTPSLIAIVRSAVTDSSRAAMMITAHAGTWPSSTIMISVASTISLSASGSRNLPSTLVRPMRRAS